MPDLNPVSGAPERETAAGAGRGERITQSNRGNPRGRGPVRGSGRGQSGRGSSRGGRGRGRGDSRPDGSSTATPAAPSAVDATEGALLLKGKAIAPAEAEDGEVCMICASPIKFISIAPCNHRTCHICGLRMRALYKTKDCAYCRTSSDYVIFTANKEKNFEEFTDGDIVKTDSVLGIKYDDSEIVEETTFLLHYNCPAADCVVACRGWPDLHRHVRGVHNKVLCDLCTRNKKVFTHEHELFTYPELRKHEKHGDDNPGATDQTGFKGHPECGFCKKRFYGDDELYAHCRDQHERCFLCDRRTEGRRPQYFLNYEALAEHFKNDHFPCLEEECLEKKFVVFDSDVDLKAHQLEAHGSGLSKTERTAARRVDLSNFNSGWTGDRRGRGQGRGRNDDDREQQTEAAVSLRRDELAYQRSMAVQSAQSLAPRRFGGRLTQEQPAVAATPRPPNDFNTNYPSLGSLSLDEPLASAPEPAPVPSPQQARQIAMQDRILALLNGDNKRFATYKAKVSDFKMSKLTANQLIDTFWSLFDTNANALGQLIEKLPELQDNSSKRSELLKAWNDWKAINEDYPALPGSTGGISATSDLPKYINKFGGSRVLKLKSATKQSEQSRVNRQTSWGNAATSPSTSVSPPPAPAQHWLPPTNRVGQGNVTTTTTWSKPSYAQNPDSAPSPKPKPTGNKNDFPSLPPGKKPEMTLFGYGTGMVRREFGSKATASPWSTPGSSTNLAGSGADDSGATSDGEAGSKKKKNKNKKQILFHMG